MKDLKLECLVKGYEGTYFEIGQVWETREGIKLKVKGFDFKADIYQLTMAEVDDSDEEYYYTSNGRDFQDEESDFDLVKLISTEPTPSEEPKQKTLSEYLKENNAYESFVENCVERALLNPERYENLRNQAKNIGDFFIWDKTKEGHNYWYNLQSNIPKPIEYDMNEIVFAEVDKRIAEQKATSKYMVFVEGRNTPRVIHDSIELAETEARRLAIESVGLSVSIVEIIKVFKSKVIVEEVE